MVRCFLRFPKRRRNVKSADFSQITRESIDVCKEHFRDDLTKNDWQLVVQLKRLLDIM